MGRKLLHADNNLTRDHDHFKQTLLGIFLTDPKHHFRERNLRTFFREGLCKPGEYPQEIWRRNDQSTVLQNNQILTFLWKISNEEDFRTVSDRFCIQRSANYPQRTRGNARDSYRFMLTSHLVNSPYFLLSFSQVVPSNIAVYGRTLTVKRELGPCLRMEKIDTD